MKIKVLPIILLLSFSSVWAQENVLQPPITTATPPSENIPKIRECQMALAESEVFRSQISSVLMLHATSIREFAKRQSEQAAVVQEQSARNLFLSADMIYSVEAWALPYKKQAPEDWAKIMYYQESLEKIRVLCDGITAEKLSDIKHVNAYREFLATAKDPRKLPTLKRKERIAELTALHRSL